MSISSFKPIDDGSGLPDDSKWQGQNNPLGAAIADRLVNNTQFIAQNRLAAHSKVWDSCLTDNTSTSNMQSSVSLPSDFVGYPGNVGGTMQNDEETRGLEFSTHPSLPLAIPFGWRVSPGAKKINVRVALSVENIAGGMYAYCTINGGSAAPRLPAIENLDVAESTYEPPTDFFTSDIRAEDSYVEAALTSTNGTAGLSYYDLEIDLADRSGSTVQSINYSYTGVVFLCFQSGVDGSGGTQNINTTNPALQKGNRLITTTSNMQKYATSKNPGKYHRVIKFTHSDTVREETWHQVIQLRPADVSLAPFDSLNSEQFVIYPSIPSDVVPPSLTGGPNADAAEGTGIESTFDIYPITKFKVYSVSIQEKYE